MVEHGNPKEPCSTTCYGVVLAHDIPKKKHDALLDGSKLNDQESLFICTMESNAKKIMEGDIITINPLTKLWRVINTSSMLRHGLSKNIKLAEIATVLVLGSMEDERTFSTLSFMKDKLRNHLQTHLPLVVSMHGQSFYNINMFPYEQAYNEWKKSIRLIHEI
jgi:hypothetical protein